MKRCQLYFLPFAVLLCVCAGCATGRKTEDHNVFVLEDSESGQKVSDKWEDIPERVKGDYDKLTIDADVVIPEIFAEGLGAIYNGEMVIFKEGDLKGLIFQEEDIKEEDLLDMDHDVIGSYTDQYYAFEDGSSISFGGPYLQYATPLAIHMANCIREDLEDPFYNMTVFSQAEDIAALSRQEAADAVQTLFGELDIAVSSIYECYALDKDTLREQERAVDVDGNVVEEWKKDEWRADDEGYLFKFHQEISGARIEDMQRLGGETVMEITYGADGFIKIYLANVYRVKEQKDEERLLTPEEITEVLEKEYYMLIDASPLEVQTMSLCYCPVVASIDQLEFRPVWKMDCVERNDVIGEWKRQLFYDAATGKEIL